MKRNILITGGCGNVGGSLARRLVKDANNTVIIVDNLITGSKNKLPDRSFANWTFHNNDCNDDVAMNEIMNSYKFDYVFHYAALVGVKRTLDSPIMVLDDIKGIENMLKLSSKTNVKKFFYSSSSEVYGEPVEFPQKEDTTPLNSRLPYAIVKNVGEAFVKSYYKEYGLDFTIFRFFNTYGPLQSNDFVMAKFINQALKGENITIYGDGMQTRTFCYVEDNLDVVESILQNNLFPNEVLNIGNNIEISMLSLAKKIISICNSTSKIVYLPALEEGDMTRRLPDISKMKQILGRDLTSIDEGIKIMIKVNFS
ncbi:NAD-dependent epimerase/dehydratase family protein [Gammaproteobacteria bacterium]|nr:NAD-dependent epimerase/dehydratase family protein [Gammaproteobacteria bacterium]